MIIYDKDFFCLVILNVKYPNVFCCFWSKGSSFICVLCDPSPCIEKHQGPAWLPAAFQHVSYLVAPPKTKAQLEQEQADRDFNGIREDPMVNVDMTPWYLAKIKKNIKQIRFFPTDGLKNCRFDPNLSSA